MTSMATSPLRREREQLGLSRRTLATVAGVSDETIRKYEQSPRLSPELVRIVSALAAARLVNGATEHHDPVVDLTDRLLSEAEKRFTSVVSALNGAEAA